MDANINDSNTDPIIELSPAAKTALIGLRKITRTYLSAIEAGSEAYEELTSKGLARAFPSLGGLTIWFVTAKGLTTKI